MRYYILAQQDLSFNPYKFYSNIIRLVKLIELKVFIYVDEITSSTKTSTQWRNITGTQSVQIIFVKEKDLPFFYVACLQRSWYLSLWYVCKKVEIGLCEVISGIYIKKFEFFNEK
jgi:hypothetical protein